MSSLFMRLARQCARLSMKVGRRTTTSILLTYKTCAGWKYWPTILSVVSLPLASALGASNGALTYLLPYPFACKVRLLGEPRICDNGIRYPYRWEWGGWYPRLPRVSLPLRDHDHYLRPLWVRDIPTRLDPQEREPYSQYGSFFCPYSNPFGTDSP
jgi:hypothetical protein